MRFAFKRSLSPVAYCALHVKAGTRYEDKNQGGLAHFTEHLLFKGTQTKSANTVNSFIERLGGELNAYTTKEETVIHATVLKEDLRKAVGLLMDIAFRCTFPDREIEKERGVVLEEINTYKDSRTLPPSRYTMTLRNTCSRALPCPCPYWAKPNTSRR